MGEKISTKDFLIRAGAVTAAAVIILLCVKIWIVDPLVAEKTRIVFMSKPTVTAESHCSSKEKKKIDWKDADKHIGEYVVTTGKIVSSYKNDKVAYLNFHKDYKNYLSLVIFANSFKKFPVNFDKFYINKTLTVEGRIKDYKGRIEIILDSPDQVREECRVK